MAAEVERVLEVARLHPELSPRLLAVQITDEEDFAVSESTVYRILKEKGLIYPRPLGEMPAQKEWRHKTTRPDELWQCDATNLFVIGWGYYKLIPVEDDFSRRIIAHDVRPDETAFSLSDILEMGLENARKEGHLIGTDPMPLLYSDNGSGFTSKLLADHIFASGSGGRLAQAAPTGSKGTKHEEDRDMEKIKIQFTLFSAFYSPLISSMSGGFLKAEGLEPEWSVAPPGVSALAALKDGSAHVVQSALSQGFTSLNKGETPEAVHFAQVNEMDGFFITGRKADPAFTWKKLEGAEVVTFEGGQPLAMFKYACHKAGIDFTKIKPISLGGPVAIDKAFRDGRGQYAHQQGPFPQQLQADGIGHIVAQVGPLIGPCAFSSLATTRDWLKTDMAKAFIRAYRKTRAYMNATPAAAIARAEKPYFPDINEKVLADCIATYQKLGCWTPHVEITKAAYEKTLDIFEYNGQLKKRWRYEQICAAPPTAD